MNRLATSLFASAALLAAACGPDAPRGLEPHAPLHLVVSGSDREMGLAHGKALAKEIQEETGARLAARLKATASDEADAKVIESACRIYTTKTKALLSPPLREELAGIAEGSGVAEDSILLLEVLHEGLRFHLDRPPLVEAALASPPAPPKSAAIDILRASEASSPVVAAWDGAGGADLAQHALLLERRPKGPARATLVVTWPGGLGALAGLSSSGIRVVEGEAACPREQQTLHGVPFAIGLRTTLESAGSVADLLAALPKLNANRLLAVDGEGARRFGLLSQISEPARAPTANEWILAPAGADADDPRARAMEAKFGSYPRRPSASDAIPLAVSGRTLQTGAVIEVFPVGIRWLTGVRADGRVAPDFHDTMVPFPAPDK